MSPKQCRMARAALKWTTKDLAEMAGVNATTVNNFENGKETFASTVRKLREALESGGEVRIKGDCCVCAEEQGA